MVNQPLNSGKKQDALDAPHPNADMRPLEAPITTLRGIGEKRAVQLTRLDIRTLRDLLLHVPVRYEDRSQTSVISALTDGTTCTVAASVAALPAHSRPRKGLSVWRLTVSDGTGYLTVVLFNRDFAIRNVRTGDKYLFFGPVKRQAARIEMTNPVMEKITDQEAPQPGILPVYRLTEGISQQQLRSYVRETLRMLAPDTGELLPLAMRERQQLMDWQTAIRTIHFPASTNEAEAARKRLAFDELLELQVALRVQRGASFRKAGVPIERHSLAPVLERLPYQCTPAQNRVIEEILADMEKPVAMNRLLQGDVGSGKTIVALLAAYAAIADGWQAALMAPTEILAQQHFQGATTLLGPLGVRVFLLKGGMRKRERGAVLEAIAAGGPDLVIGTHALLVEDVAFARLGLVITDEQHRFGVRQRAQLFGKGHTPHMLVMTATPIPRTLSLAFYGDLDASVIDALPPGRKPVKTYVVGEGMRSRIEAFMRKTVQEGQQVYVVCPLVEDSEEMSAESAESVAARYREQVFPELRVGLLHGRMKPEEKDAVMRTFADGNLDILVSTTVIEVGVNVPNASVMVVENAERFGLSQLHQLRGRVGRGAAQSHCVLFQGNDGKTVQERLRAIAGTQDGFALAELDLKLRGPGEVLGTRQSGLPEYRVADPFVDLDLVQAARAEAGRLEGPEADPALRPLRNRLLAQFARRVHDIAPN